MSSSAGWHSSACSAAGLVAGGCARPALALLADGSSCACDSCVAFPSGGGEAAALLRGVPRGMPHSGRYGRGESPTPRPGACRVVHAPRLRSVLCFSRWATPRLVSSSLSRLTTPGWLLGLLARSRGAGRCPAWRARVVSGLSSASSETSCSPLMGRGPLWQAHRFASRIPVLTTIPIVASGYAAVLGPRGRCGRLTALPRAFRCSPRLR